jgi:uridine phosphorylase
MNSIDPKLTALRFNECINRQDIDGLASLMSEGHTFIDRQGQIDEGKQSLIRGWKEFFRSFPDYRNTFLRVESQGDVVVLYGFATWRQGAEPDHAIWTATIEDDLVAEWHIYEDSEENRRRYLRQEATYPLLEHDPSGEAFIEPSRVYGKRDLPKHCVICFFRDVLDKVIAERQARMCVENRWEDGPHPIYEIAHRGQRLAFFHPGIGSALSASLLEEAIAFGCRKFIACGGCGALQKDTAVGHLIAVSAAVRDEGASYHYLAPAREVQANKAALQALVSVLQARGVPYVVGKAWTTDAPYRETAALIERRREEGCLAVEMEAAGMMAVAKFRKVPFAQILYAGDDLSGPEWDNRDWQSRADVRERLFWLAAQAVLAL